MPLRNLNLTLPIFDLCPELRVALMLFFPFMLSFKKNKTFRNVTYLVPP